MADRFQTNPNASNLLSALQIDVSHGPLGKGHVELIVVVEAQKLHGPFQTPVRAGVEGKDLDRDVRPSGCLGESSELLPYDFPTTDGPTQYSLVQYGVQLWSVWAP